MANLLAATAATHGGVISRAISNGKRFSGGRSISSTSSSHVILDKLSATKILQCAFAGKIQPPPRPERIDADADELCMSPDCNYFGYACQKLGEDGEYHCLNCWSTNDDLNVPHDFSCLNAIASVRSIAISKPITSTTAAASSSACPSPKPYQLWLIYSPQPPLTGAS